MFSFGMGDYFFPMIAFNFTLWVTLDAFGLYPSDASSLSLFLVFNILTLVNLSNTYSAKEKASQLSLTRDLHGIPLIPFLLLAACFFLSLLVYFHQVDESFNIFVFVSNLVSYVFFTAACLHNFKKLSRYLKCPMCSRVLYNTADYCDRCGEPLSKKAKKEQANLDKKSKTDKKNKNKAIPEPQFKGICPQCRSKLLVGSRFCPKCGYSLEE